MHPAPGLDPMTLPPDLPVPVDDGGADHLPGLVLPTAVLRSTRGKAMDVAELAADRCVLFVFPAMGRPGEEMPRGWDATPGARGCTPQSCGFRDRHSSFEELGYAVAGVSAQAEEDQAEAAQRLGLPFELLSDPELVLASRLRLPIFEIAGMKLYKRLTLIAHRGVIAKVFYPVFPPQHNAEEVLQWLRDHSAATR